MEVYRELVAAIESFDQWDQPWEFYMSVSSQLGNTARAELERIWATATETASWSICRDLAHGCSLADARLSSNYPWLPATARQQLVKGASYLWR